MEPSTRLSAASLWSPATGDAAAGDAVGGATAWAAATSRTVIHSNAVWRVWSHHIVWVSLKRQVHCGASASLSHYLCLLDGSEGGGPQRRQNPVISTPVEWRLMASVAAENAELASSSFGKRASVSNSFIAGCHQTASSSWRDAIVWPWQAIHRQCASQRLGARLRRAASQRHHARGLQPCCTRQRRGHCTGASQGRCCCASQRPWHWRDSRSSRYDGRCHHGFGEQRGARPDVRRAGARDLKRQSATVSTLCP